MVPLLPQEKATVPHICGVNGSKIGFDYVTSTATASYYYVYNLQGDVIAIIDSNNTTVVEYTYNEWGKLTATTGTLATTIGLYNPATSGGYYFMKEVAYLASKGISMLPIF